MQSERNMRSWEEMNAKWKAMKGNENQQMTSIYQISILGQYRMIRGLLVQLEDRKFGRSGKATGGGLVNQQVASGNQTWLAGKSTINGGWWENHL